VIVGVGAMSLWSGGGSAKSIAATMRAAGCTYKDVKPLPPKDKSNYHNDVKTLTVPTRWSTFPPTAGGHYGQWAVWGFYRTAVNPRQVVHNEEHGAVVIWWGPDVPSATVDQLAAFYDGKTDGMFGTPITGLGKKIALTAWTGDPATYSRHGDFGIGHIATCSSFNAKAFAAFRDTYLGKGPEGVPLSSDLAGMGPNG